MKTFVEPITKSTQSRPCKRSRSDVNSVACNRCKSRKQKCTGDSIAGNRCLNCERANAVCEYSVKRSPNYIKLLEARVSQLEKELVKKDNEMKESREGHPPPEKVLNHTETHNVVSPSPNGVVSVSDVAFLTKCAALFPLKDDMEPLYVGSSGLNIASLLQAHLKLELADSLRSSPFAKVSPKYVPNELALNSLNDLLNDEKRLHLYIDNYILKIHNKYPFLSTETIFKLHENRHSFISSDNANLKEEHILSSFIILMVYAIGSMLTGKQYPNHHGTSEPSIKHDNVLLFTTAIKLNLSVIFEHKNIHNIHCMLLVVVYQLRLPNGAVIWDMIEFALRLCVSFGFHRKNHNLLHERPIDYQFRVLTFWSTYSLERTISSSFGRPFSLADRDIDVELPVNIDESIVDDGLIIQEYYNRVNGVQIPEDLTSRSQAIHNFKFKIIESEIQSELYRVDLHYIEVPRAKINSIIIKMKHWAKTIPVSVSSSEYDYYLYLFNKQIRYLIQPFLHRLDKNDPLFTECMNSSLTICKLSKRMHHNTRTRFSFVALQAVFLSGVTLIYGLLSSKLNWNFSISEGLRCCSSILFSVSERTPTCGIFSEIFEKLVSQVEQSEKSKSMFATENNSASNIHNEELIDLFGQENLRRNVQESHRRENLANFDEISQSNHNLKELQTMFDFTNLDMLGSEKIDEMIKKTYRGEDHVDERIFFSLF